MVDGLLWLFVVNLGLACGAGLYESRVMVPLWFTPTEAGDAPWDAGAARRADVGRRFWVHLTTLPLTVLTLASLAAAWQEPPSVRAWWLGGAVAALLDRGMTFAYFLPAMVRLMDGEQGATPDATARARRWARLGHLRQVTTLTAWLAALMALYRLGGIPPR
ncbi:MAG: hypothetical protein H6P99_1136 [Holophagaceae bacterium]|nr:hypothetical protein [Holophagaceae bacterium]